MLLKREVQGETIWRAVIINRTRYDFKKSWHYLGNGDQYHLIHVYRGFNTIRPIKAFRWTVSPEGEVTIR